MASTSSHTMRLNVAGKFIEIPLSGLGQSGKKIRYKHYHLRYKIMSVSRAEILTAHKNSSKQYSEVPIIRPPMILVESGLNSEQVLLMRPHLY